MWEFMVDEVALIHFKAMVIKKTVGCGIRTRRENITYSEGGFNIHFTVFSLSLPAKMLYFL
jgi:hypothetical protein